MAIDGREYHLDLWSKINAFWQAACLSLGKHQSQYNQGTKCKNSGSHDQKCYVEPRNKVIVSWLFLLENLLEN